MGLRFETKSSTERFLLFNWKHDSSEFDSSSPALILIAMLETNRAGQASRHAKAASQQCSWAEAF